MESIDIHKLTNKPKLLIYFLATRPSFLTITVIGCLIGFSIANSNNNYLINTFGLILALLAHAGSNVINDYYDSINGTDAINKDRIYPYTGGSRFIQDKIFSATQIRRISLAIFVITIVGGIFLSYSTNPWLLLIGLTGLILGWSYSASPFKLMSRGLLGEIAITLSWSLVVFGAYFLHGYSNDNLFPPIFISFSYGLIVSTILYVNQIPDIKSDRLVGKLTLATKVKKKHIWLYYLLILMCSYMTIVVGCIAGELSWRYLSVGSLLPIHVYATHLLRSYVSDRSMLKKSIVLTIMAAHLFGLILIINNMI
jgi:1,4-dihydroxy-2-naphthoate octaprenyltransferase